MGLLTSKSIDELSKREEARSLQARTLHKEKNARPHNKSIGTTRRAILKRVATVAGLAAALFIQRIVIHKMYGVPNKEEPDENQQVTPEEAQPGEIAAYFATRLELEARKEQFLKALKAFKDVNEETRRLFEIASNLANFSVTTEPLQTAVDCATGPVDAIHIMFRKVEGEKEGHLPPIFTKRISPTDQSVVISEEITSPEWLAIWGYGALYQLLRQRELDACGQDKNCASETAVEIGYGIGKLHCALLEYWQSEAYRNFIDAASKEKFDFEEGQDVSMVRLDASEFPSPGESDAAQEQMKTTLLACLMLEWERKIERETASKSQNQ